MTVSDREQNLRSDSALQAPEQDQLGYSDFSEHIAETVCGWTPNEEFVVGIYGQWGAGKSTILNFVETELRDQEESPVIIRFNPWWFSGQADLIEKFFSQLRTGLEGDARLGDVRDQLAALSRTVSKVPFYKLTGVPAGPFIGKAADIISTNDKNIGELKSDISKTLQELDQPIVIFIDDIDRLTNEEIRQMFRLIKSVADFPNIIYLLAFDREIVVNALEAGERGVQNGDEYLEKIIQLPQHVPIPQEGSLDRFFTDRLDAIVGEDEIVFNGSHWQTVYKHGIDPLVKTPRDAIRLTNAVRTSYQALRHEVNYVDLIAVETLRIHFNGLYNSIRTNKERFTNRRQMNQSEDPDFSDIWKDFDGKNEECAKMLLSYLFPRFKEDGLSITRSISENDDTYRKRKRICHPEMFPYYFRQTVPEGEIPMDEFETILTATDSSAKFENYLLDLSKQQNESGRSLAHNFLTRFEEHASDIENEDEVIRALFSLSDHLIQTDPPVNQMNSGNRGNLFRTTYNILEQSENPVSILENGIQQDGSSYFAAYFLGLLLQEHGEYSGRERHEENQLLSRDNIKDLQDVWLSELKSREQEDKLSDAPNLDTILDRWAEWGKQEDAADWAQSYVSDDDLLIELVDDFLREGRSSAIGKLDFIDPQWLDPFLNPADVEDRFESLDLTKRSQQEKKVVQKFQKGREFQEAGKDPGSFQTWTFAKRSEMG